MLAAYRFGVLFLGETVAPKIADRKRMSRSLLYERETGERCDDVTQLVLNFTSQSRMLIVRPLVDLADMTFQRKMIILIAE